MEKYVNIQQVADYLGICKMTIYSWRCKGWIPVYKIGGRLVFRLSEIEKFAQTCKEPMVAKR